MPPVPNRGIPPEGTLRYLFDLDADRGLLVRRVTRAHNAQKGAVVGTVDGKGYLHVNILGRFYRVHRIVYLLHYGCNPDAHIDHINGVRSDNRPVNLRVADDKQNQGNVAGYAHNSSGFRGVSRNSKSGKWHAQIKIGGVQTYLGRFDTPEEAANVYTAAAKAHFGETYFRGC